MVNEEEVKNRISDNLVYYRKKAKMTQLEAANKLSYSDKAISKWERGLGLPDVVVLAQLADVYGTTLPEIVGTYHKRDLSENEASDSELKILSKRHLLISALSVGVLWLIAAILFFLFTIIFKKPGEFYLLFIYAIPGSLLISLIFNIIWGKAWYNSLYESLFAWTLSFSVILTIFPRVNNPLIWYSLLIPLALQALIIFWNNLLNTGRIFKSKSKINKEEKKNGK